MSIERLVTKTSIAVIKIYIYYTNQAIPRRHHFVSDLS